MSGQEGVDGGLAEYWWRERSMLKRWGDVGLLHLGLCGGGVLLLLDSR